MKRIDWIDSLKGFGIVCVTLGHLGCHWLIAQHIYSFHMFLFFFLSGFLHNNCQGNFKEYISKKTKALLIPFLAWNVLSNLIGLFVYRNIGQSLRYLFLLDGEICLNSPIWFLWLLFLVQLVYFFVKKYIPYGCYVIIPVLVACWILIPNHNVFLKLNILPVCLLFYVLGDVFKELYQRGEHLFYNRRWYIPLLAFVLICSNLAFGIVLNKRVSFTLPTFGNVFYCIIAAVTGVLFYVLLFQNITILTKSKILSYLGKNSLIIMAAQYWFFYLYDEIYTLFADKEFWNYQNTIKAVIATIVTIFLICTITELLKRANKRFSFLKNICAWFGIKA